MGLKASRSCRLSIPRPQLRGVGHLAPAAHVAARGNASKLFAPTCAGNSHTGQNSKSVIGATTTTTTTSTIVSNSSANGANRAKAKVNSAAYDADLRPAGLLAASAELTWERLAEPLGLHGFSAEMRLSFSETTQDHTELSGHLAVGMCKSPKEVVLKFGYQKAGNAASEDEADAASPRDPPVKGAKAKKVSATEDDEELLDPDSKRGPAKRPTCNAVDKKESKELKGERAAGAPKPAPEENVTGPGEKPRKRSRKAL